MKIKIISGGQTGVDQAAIDVARSWMQQWGGWVPKGWRTEEPDNLPPWYRDKMAEHPSTDYRDRTVDNIRDAHATLIVHMGPMSPGTRYTLKNAVARPHWVADLAAPRIDHKGAQGWLSELLSKHGNALILNVAGPRESKAEGIYLAATKFLHTLFDGAGL